MKYFKIVSFIMFLFVLVPIKYGYSKNDNLTLKGFWLNLSHEWKFSYENSLLEKIYSNYGTVIKFCDNRVFLMVSGFLEKGEEICITYENGLKIYKGEWEISECGRIKINYKLISAKLANPKFKKDLGILKQTIAEIKITELIFENKAFHSITDNKLKGLNDLMSCENNEVTIKSKKKLITPNAPVP